MAVISPAARRVVVERALTRSLTSGRDRCDRCGSSAYVKVRLGSGGELLFCGHHASKHESGYLPLAAHVLDERSFIPV